MTQQIILFGTAIILGGIMFSLVKLAQKKPARVKIKVKRK